MIIKTSTLEMNREQWLQFRSPLHHIKQHLHRAGVIFYDPNKPMLRNNQTVDKLKAYFNTKAWANLVVPCIGASEVGTVMGLNKYKSTTEMFYEKVGLKPEFNQENRFAFWGKELEAKIAEVWEFWDGDIETTIGNVREGRRIRRCKKINAYCQNSKFQWLFVSLDREINKDDKNKGNGALECKTISGYVVNQWESGIPPQYIAQLQTQMAVCEYRFGELAMLKDGRDYEVIPFTWNQGIIDSILKKTKLFWEKIKMAIQWVLIAQATEDEINKSLWIGEADMLSPEPDGSTSYLDYLKDNTKDNGGEVQGGLLEYYNGVMFKVYKNQADIANQKAQLFGNRLKAFLKDRSIILLDKGRITWKEDASGTRRFNVGITYGADDIELAVKAVQYGIHGSDVIPEVPTGYETPGVTVDIPEDLLNDELKPKRVKKEKKPKPVKVKKEKVVKQKPLKKVVAERKKAVAKPKAGAKKRGVKSTVPKRTKKK